ncbi:MAG: lamin tail domain-containing protein [Opitutaceae bacterium]
MKKLHATSLALIASSQCIFGQAWINEFHYDNASTDVNEFIEVFVGDSLLGEVNNLKISLYNGSDEELYGSNDEFIIGTDFTVGDSIPGYGTLYYYNFEGNPGSLQNGPDGIALTNNGSLVQFLSYEGPVGPAGDGDALGATSTEIGVIETSSTPAGSSLALTGTGGAYDNFVWATDSDDTPGSINNNQAFSSFVAAPTDASAAATDASSIELSFTSNGVDDVVIVYNSTGSFTEPTGSVPAIGNSFAGGTVLYNGTSSPQTHSSLTPDVEVFYAFYSVTTGDLYSAGLFDSATPNKLTFSDEDFSAVSTWVNQTVSGTGDGWSTTGDAFISGFGETTEENHYLVSPAFDFSSSTDLSLEFDYQERFDGPDLMILYSTDYTGSGNPEANGTWSEIPFTFNDLSTTSTYAGDSASIDLPLILEGFPSVHLAFKYTTDTDAETWIIDNIMVSSSAAAQTIDPEPSSQAGSFTATSSGISGIDLAWTDPTGGQEPFGYLVLGNTTGVFTDPVDGTFTQTDSDLSDGSGALNILQGTQSADFSGLPSGSQFFFKVFAYTNSGVNIDYLLTSAPTDDATTDTKDPEPAAYPTGFAVVADGLSLNLDWTDAGDAAGYLILVNTTGSFTAPVDGVDPVADSDLTDGSAQLKIDQGTATASIVGLPETTYFATIYPYTNSDLNIDFKTDGVPPEDSDTTAALPELIISEIMKNPTAVGDTAGEYFEVFNAGTSDVDLIGYIVKDDDSDSFEITTNLIVPAGEFILFGRNADDTANGGITPDYIFSGMNLSNGVDEIILVAPDGITEVDRVVYDTANDFPSPAGESMVFIGNKDNDNNIGAFWIEATVREPGFIGQSGDLGSPGFNGTGQILADFLFPSNVSVTSETPTSATLSFDVVGAVDVVVVFNSTGVFTAPSGTPIEGNSLAGGTVLYVGDSSPITHSSLTSGEEVFYALYYIDGASEYSLPIERSVAPGLVNSEDFGGGSATWFNSTVTGDDPWDTSGSTALVDGAETPNTGDDNHYLVSPSFDLSDKAGLTIEFDYGQSFDGPDVTLAYSLDYSGSGDPSASTWVPIALTLEDDSDTVSTPDTNSGAVALPAAIEGESSVRLAFIYTADGTFENSEGWEIDNILVLYSSIFVEAAPLDDYLTARGLTAVDLTTDADGNGFTVIEEYLAGVGDGVGSDTIEFGIDTDSGLALTLVSDRDNEPAGITVNLLATSDLGVAFAPVSFGYSVVDNLDGTYTHIYEETTPPADEQRFLQLQIIAD